jgi:hypothetical protein
MASPQKKGHVDDLYEKTYADCQPFLKSKLMTSTKQPQSLGFHSFRTRTSTLSLHSGESSRNVCCGLYWTVRAPAARDEAPLRGSRLP